MYVYFYMYLFVFVCNWLNKYGQNTKQNVMN